MQNTMPLACFLSLIRPPGIQFENAILQIAPVDKIKCPFVRDKSDVGFRLYTRHNPTVYQELRTDDDESLFASNIDFHDNTIIHFHAFMESPDDGSGVMIREGYVHRGDTNVIMVDAQHLEAGPWYFTAADNTWYIGRYAAEFIDYLVSRGLKLEKTHLIGHSLGAQAAGVAGSALQSGRVSRITGLDPALPLFEKLPPEQKLDPADAEFVDVIHTDAGIFGYKYTVGHVDFFPNGGKSPQPGCELEVVIPQQLLLNKCDETTQTHGYYIYYLQANTLNSANQTTHDTKRNKVKRHTCHTIPLDVNTESENKTDYSNMESLNTDSNLQSDLAHKIVKKEKLDLPSEPEQTTNKQEKGQGQTDIPGVLQRSLPSILRLLSQNNESMFKKLRNMFKKGNIFKRKQTKKHDLFDFIQSERLKRNRRFATFLRKSETSENDNFLLKLLEFIFKNRRNVVPVITVMREINTLVKSNNGELNHLIKERNNYIGSPPKIQPVTYSLELGNDGRIRSFVKRLLGMNQGDKLSVTTN